MGAPRVSHEDFVVCWTTSHTPEDVMKGTEMNWPAIRERAKRLREAGVKLKKLPRPNSNRLDDLAVSQLNSLINKYSK